MYVDLIRSVARKGWPEMPASFNSAPLPTSMVPGNTVTGKDTQTAALTASISWF